MGTIMPGLVKIRLRWGLAEAFAVAVVGLAYVRIMTSIEPDIARPVAKRPQNRPNECCP